MTLTETILRELAEHNTLPPIREGEFAAPQLAEALEMSASSARRGLNTWIKHGFVTSRSVLQNSQPCIGYTVINMKGLLAFLKANRRGLRSRNAKPDWEEATDVKPTLRKEHEDHSIESYSGFNARKPKE
ncbi:MAG: hypothetical protein KKC55_16170 [Gammaproteobacteria bacterium]|nr:hypothetical protein [Gammaproteobacteria bacterium]